MKEAMLYEREEDQRVRCELCAHRCLIAEGRSGICQVRENRAGTLYTLVYGRAIARHVDPVEKKPLYHFHPGSASYSVAAPGCNFRCKWCQNADISQLPRVQSDLPGMPLPPEEIVSDAERLACRSIAYTYTEPTIFYEYAYDTARLAADTGIANVFVTNGYMTSEMLDQFHPLLDAANIDLKAFRDETYRRYVGARLQPVLDSLRKVRQLGIWLEVTTLVIPGINDSPEELRDTVEFIVSELGPDTPWHVSAFHPAYEMRHVSSTPIEKLQQAAEIGKEEGLEFVYLGNVPGESNTYCSECGELLIRRVFYAITANKIDADSRCPECGAKVPGVGMSG